MFCLCGRQKSILSKFCCPTCQFYFVSDEYREMLQTHTQEEIQTYAQLLRELREMEKQTQEMEMQ